MADHRRDDPRAGMDTMWAVASTVPGGAVVMGGAGYLADRFFGTGGVLTAIGFLIGTGLGLYIIYLRYGKEQGGDGNGA